MRTRAAFFMAHDCFGHKSNGRARSPDAVSERTRAHCVRVENAGSPQNLGSITQRAADF